MRIIILILILSFTGCGTSYLPVQQPISKGILIYKGLTYSKVRKIPSNKIITFEDVYPMNSVGDTIQWYDYEWETEKPLKFK